MTDKKIIDGLIKNDHHIFKYFVKQNQNNVIRTCYGMVHNMDDAKDIAQDVFIEVFKSVKKFKGKSSLSTWLYRIAVNKALNFIRNNKIRSLDLPIDQLTNGQLKNNTGISPNQNTFINSQDNDQKKKLIHQAIDSLPENQKTAFILNKYEELSYKQISETMEISLSAVESLIYRAKTNLQQKLISLKKNNY